MQQQHPNPKNQLRGAQNRAAGAIFEQHIDAACSLYRERGQAYIEKTPEPMRPIKALGAGKYIAVFTQSAQPDYKGTLPHGRAIAFEAKHTDDDLIKQERVTPAQTEALTLHDKLGAQCFVLVSIRMQSFYRIPWVTWQNMKQLYGHKHMTAKELEPYKLQLQPNWFSGGIIDFLERT